MQSYRRTSANWRKCDVYVRGVAGDAQMHREVVEEGNGT